MTHSDEKFAREIGIDLSTCHDCREMDALHREHIERLSADLETCAELEQFLVHGSLLEKQDAAKRELLWKRVAFAGWFAASLLLLHWAKL